MSLMAEVKWWAVTRVCPGVCNICSRLLPWHRMAQRGAFQAARWEYATKVYFDLPSRCSVVFLASPVKSQDDVCSYSTIQIDPLDWFLDTYCNVRGISKIIAKRFSKRISKTGF